MNIEFFMAMKPPRTTHQQKSIRVVKGKPIVYEDEKLKSARSKLEAHLYKHVPFAPYTGPVRVITKWLFPRGKEKDGAWKLTNPDVTNLQKLLEDCMTAVGFWEDDNIIASSVVEKFWAEVPGIYIKIEELE